jgi:hypothetical protein
MASVAEQSEAGFDLASPAQPLPAATTPTTGNGSRMHLSKEDNPRKSPAERAAERKAREESGEAVEPRTPSGKKPGSARQKSVKKRAAPEPKVPLGMGFLKTALNKATWGITLAKAFAPKLELNARNRVKVGVRFRPLSEGETKRGDGDKLKPGNSWLELEEATAHVTISNPRPPAGQEAKTDYYAFDHLYGPEKTTKTVFNDLCVPLITYLIAGYNGTIFAYGQTGSGKTHSIMGYGADPGVVPRCCEELTKMLAELDPAKGTFTLKASYLQIYREVLHDL